MTCALPRKQYRLLTRLAGLLTYSTSFPPSRPYVDSGLLEWMRLNIKSLQQRDCTGLSPVSLLIRISKGDCFAEQDAAKLQQFRKNPIT